MAKIVLGALPQPLEVQLVHGDGADLVATLTDDAGAELDWPSVPTLEFSGAARTVVASQAALVVGPVATWTLGRAQVDAIWDATKGLSQSTLVRATLPDGDNGSVEYAGAVVWSDGWTAGKRTQAVSFSLRGEAGASAYEIALANGFEGTEQEWLDSLVGGGGSSSSVIIVSGGTVDLDNTKPNGHYVTYRVTSTTGIEGVPFAPGWYSFVRDSTDGSGWRYWTLPTPASVTTLTPVTPGNPTQDDVADTYTIPATTGVVYKVGGVVKAAGAHSVANANISVIITAEAATGYALTDPVLAGKTDWSWTFNFTYSLIWTTLLHDTFAGTNGSQLEGRVMDTTTSLSWDRTDVLSATTTIDTNRLKLVTGGGNQVVRAVPVPTITTPAEPDGVRHTFVYDTATQFTFNVRYLSNAFLSLQTLEYRIGGGVISVSGTGADNTNAQLTPLAGKALTGQPAAGKFCVEISGTVVKVFVNDVQIALGSLPGDLRAPDAGFSVTTGGTAYINEYKLEVGAAA